MSIQRRLAISITLVLLFSLVVGAGLTYRHVLIKVRTELQAALAVGAYTAGNALDQRRVDADPLGALRAVVRDFNGDRHLQAVLRAPDGAELARSRLALPEDPAPSWFVHLAVSKPPRAVLTLPPSLRDVGSLILEANPHNEVAEAWSDLRLTLTIMAVFFAAVLFLAFAVIRAALAPLRDVCAALLRIGDGDYDARIDPQFARELRPLRDGFNAMAAHLQAMSLQNQALEQQMINLQEEERAELARDLHDDVAPFVFAVGADAAMIRQYLTKGAVDEIGPRAESIAEAIKHMQRHLKDVLRRLAPSALLDLGLSGAIGNLVGFWSARKPDIAFSHTVDGDPLDPPLDAVAFRVVQESISNAIRHGAPRAIDVMIDVDDERAVVVVEDDGAGFAEGKPRRGFGLAGMADRVGAVGGTVTVRNRSVGGGVIVEAVLPVAAKRTSLGCADPPAPALATPTALLSANMDVHA